MFENAIGLKQKYRSGAQIVGVSMPPDTTADRFEKILDQDDYDYVSVDSQHTPFNEERLAAFCEIAAERDVFVQFRIKHTRNAYLIGNYLDLGPCGVEVPQTETDETAKEAVDSFYYPPAGVRSLGGGIDGVQLVRVRMNTARGGTVLACCGCKWSLSRRLRRGIC